MSSPRCLSSRTSFPGISTTLTPPPPSGDWRCTCCGKLLGQFRGDRLHVRFTRGHEYLVSLPAQATCRGCGTLNEAAAPAR